LSWQPITDVESKNNSSTLQPLWCVIVRNGALQPLRGLVGPCVQRGGQNTENFPASPYNSRIARSANSPGVCNCLCSHSAAIYNDVLQVLLCFTTYILHSTSSSFHASSHFSVPHVSTRLKI
jgi:hypothetical protein